MEVTFKWKMSKIYKDIKKQGVRVWGVLGLQ